jgi:hypothetical protein
VKVSGDAQDLEQKQTKGTKERQVFSQARSKVEQEEEGKG